MARAAHAAVVDEDARPALLSMEQAARRIGVSRGLLYRQAAEGKLKTVKVGTRRLVPRTEIDRIARGE